MAAVTRTFGKTAPSADGIAARSVQREKFVPDSSSGANATGGSMTSTGQTKTNYPSGAYKMKDTHDADSSNRKDFNDNVGMGAVNRTFAKKGKLSNPTGTQDSKGRDQFVPKTAKSA